MNTNLTNFGAEGILLQSDDLCKAERSCERLSDHKFGGSP